MPDKKEEVKKVEVKEKYYVAEVATQTEKVIVDSEEEKTYDIYSALVKIMNDISELRKDLTGK